MQNKADLFKCPECGLESLDPLSLSFSLQEMARRCKYYEKSGSDCPNILRELDRIAGAAVKQHGNRLVEIGLKAKGK